MMLLVELPYLRADIVKIGVVLFPSDVFHHFVVIIRILSLPKPFEAMVNVTHQGAQKKDSSLLR
jgi:hypothetical protein